ALTEELGVGELIIQLSRTSPQQSLGALVPGISLRQPIQPLPKPRVTATAVAMVQRLQAQAIRLQPGQQDRLIGFHARQPQLAPDYGLAPTQLADLRGRFMADIERLAKATDAQLVGQPTIALAAE
ncbi:MAG: hypothetical protein WBA91_12070, partial [Paracoccaceae bacterium]